jgi:hypothetical protein
MPDPKSKNGKFTGTQYTKPKPKIESKYITKGSSIQLNPAADKKQGGGAYNNNGGVDNAAKFFNDANDARLKRMQPGGIANGYVEGMTMTNHNILTDSEKLELHDKKAKRFLNKKNKKGPFKGGKSNSKPYN